jgi:hypothetical protein
MVALSQVTTRHGVFARGSLTDDWIWALALCATPFIIFGAIELAAMMRRRRYAAIARRSKGRG